VNVTTSDTLQGTVELDSHADTCCAGSNCTIIEYTGKVCNVIGYNRNTPNDELFDVPIVTAATAYDAPNGDTYILILAQTLYLGGLLDYTLLCPNQLRSNGIIVDDVPKHLSPDPSMATHSVYAPNENVRIPLDLKGVISYFVTRAPTPQEVETCKWIALTSDTDWDPHSDIFKINESSHNNDEDKTNTFKDRTLLSIYTNTHLSSETGASLAAISSALSDDILPIALRDTVSVTYDKAIQISATSTTQRGSSISKEYLSQLWGISLSAAAQTLQVTTQKGIKNAVHPIVRRYATKQSRLRYNQLGSRHGQFYSDTFFATTRSTRGNTMAQLYVNDIKYMRIMPMKKKSEAPFTLQELIQDIGVPAALHCDGAKELQHGKWRDICNDFGIKLTTTEPYSPWQNRAEVNIREAKKSIHRLMTRTRTPKPLWDYCATYVAEIISITANDLYASHGRTPYEVITGNTPDISEWAEFGWYEPVYQYQDVPFPQTKRIIARWLGVAHRVGQALCYWILTESGQVVARTSIQKLTDDELKSPVTITELAQFDEKIQAKLGKPILETEDENSNTYFLDIYDDEGVTESYDPDAARDEDDLYPDQDTYDQYITSQVLLPRGDNYEKGTVKRRKRDANGNVVGRANANPILDTRVYEVEFSDGHVAEFSTNVIAENIYAMVDSEGYETSIFKAIIDHRCDPSKIISPQNAWVTSYNGNQVPRRTTAGWELCVQWTDNTTSWLPLKDVKGSNAIETAEYAFTHHLSDEPAFSWWIHDVLKKRDRFIAASHTRYIKRTHKFGIRLPKTVEEALQIDQDMGNTLWHDAIQKEMKNNAIAFEFLSPGTSVPIGYKKITLHMVFDIKMDLSRKARLVAGGHLTSVPTNLTYSSVVSRESVRIMFLLAALNDLQILSADIGNAYLNAPNREKVYATAGKEFGSRVGETVIIVRALYGLKSAGAAWRSHLADSLHSLGYRSCLADPDIWLREAIKSDNSPYYEYLAIYVDDTLCISERPNDTMMAIARLYRLKDNSLEVPRTYLGAQVVQYKLPQDSSKVRWGLSSAHYISQAIKNVEYELSLCGQGLANNISTPIAFGYRPELDTTPLLNPDQANYYQSLIGVLRWAIELGRIDILIHVSMLSSFLAAPRQGHLSQVHHIFAYLKKYPRSTMVFDDTTPIVDPSTFFQADWTEFYRDAKELIPPNAPTPRGKPVEMYCFCDADHAGDKITRRSHSGILLFLNRAPILWYSKKQNTVETSTFGAEFVALRIAVELIEGLRYKLRMMGVPIDGSCTTFVIMKPQLKIQQSLSPHCVVNTTRSLITEYVKLLHQI